MRRAALILLVVLAALPTATASATCSKASLPNIEGQVMCLVCGVPLSLADSPQASRERDFINALIDKCESTSQIKAALVAQYGPRVLALPKDNGFNAAVYIVPVLALLVLAALAFIAVRWWSSHGRNADPVIPAPVGADARRLEAEMSRWER
ncbi:MAG TPA: cytochrome c-type biogenesis protein CcmH [Thermoleophilaceae bacterium]|nr:cytochrome c-type biogenesis protein CcmH [Thermoleophilaceae bacterium]